MCKCLLYKPNKNCAEIPAGCQTIEVSLGGLFLMAHPVYTVRLYILILGVVTYRDRHKKRPPGETSIVLQLVGISAQFLFGL